MLQNPLSTNRTTLEQDLTDRHTRVVRQLIDESIIQPQLVGFHGQTSFHRPRTETSKAQTVQIGDGQRMANDLGIPVVYEFSSTRCE